MDVDFWISRLKKGEKLFESSLKNLLRGTKVILKQEPNVLPLNSPINVCGNTQGHFYDLLNLFKIGGELPSNSYLFLGDYVNKGFRSILSVSYLFALKVKYPKKIFLLRGHHECRQITEIFGFKDEVVRFYGNERIWEMFCGVFKCLPLCAVIDSKIFCVHAGLSVELPLIENIQSLNRFQEVPHEGPMFEMLWSDPEDLGEEKLFSWGRTPMYGKRASIEFCSKNNLEMICRSHTLTNEGYKFCHDKFCVTVWSAPNYCYRCDNLAAFLYIDENGRREFKYFKETEESYKTAQMISSRMRTRYYYTNYFNGGIYREMNEKRSAFFRKYSKMKAEDSKERITFLFDELEYNDKEKFKVHLGQCTTIQSFKSFLSM